MLSRICAAMFVCLLLAGPARAQTYVFPLAMAVHSVETGPAGPSSEYDDLIAEHARANDVRPSLVRAVIQVESKFNPGAVSPKGAIGLMQLMPSTIQQFGVHNAFNPAENIRAGVAYLRQLLDRYDNNEALALAAYNAGPGAVDRHGETIPPYRETQQYVSKVTDLAGVKATRVMGSQMYRIVQMVNGRERVLYSNDPAARFSPAALSQADRDARTPAQALQTLSALQSP